MTHSNFEIDPDDVESYLERMNRSQSVTKAFIGGVAGVLLCLFSYAGLMFWAHQNSVYFLPVLLIPPMTVRVAGRGWGLTYRFLGLLFCALGVFACHILSGSIEAVNFQPEKLLPFLQKLQPETITNLLKLQQTWYLPWLDGIVILMGPILAAHAPSQGDFEAMFHTDFTDKMDREIMMELSQAEAEKEQNDSEKAW